MKASLLERWRGLPELVRLAVALAVFSLVLAVVIWIMYVAFLLFVMFAAS